MKIGIDVTPILYEGTGVGEYTRNLVGELLRQNQQDEFVLFFSTLRGYRRIKGMIKELDPRPTLSRGQALRGDDKKGRGNGGVRVVGIPLPPVFWQLIWNRLNFFKIERLIGKVDIFHCWDYLMPPSDCPCIVTIHDITPILFPETHTKRMVDNFKLIIEKIKIEKIFVLTDSQSTKKDLEEKAGIDEKKIQVVYLGVRGDGGNPGFVDDRRLVINNQEVSEKFILSVGTREPRKNLGKVIGAFSHLFKKYPDIELVVAGRYGWGNEEEYRDTEVSEYRRKVKILGFVREEDLMRLYKNAICLVYPSLYEGFGFPVLEAMKQGCPVITSDVSSLPEVGGDAVLYVDPSNVEQLLDTMIRIIVSADMRQGLVNKGFEQAKKFSWEKCASETYQIYKKLTNI